jgi:hypothetical protein
MSQRTTADSGLELSLGVRVVPSRSGQFLCTFWSAAMVTILLILQLSVAHMQTPPRESVSRLQSGCTGHPGEDVSH